MILFGIIIFFGASLSPAFCEEDFHLRRPSKKPSLSPKTPTIYPVLAPAVYSSVPSVSPLSTPLPSTSPTVLPSYPPVPIPTPTELPSEASQFLILINDFRKNNGIESPLTISPILQNAAQWMSESMATYDYFSHYDNLGRDPGTRLISFGESPNVSWGENIFAGDPTALGAFTAWSNSAGHRANMLYADYHVIGIGIAYGASSTYGWYWTTDFASF